MNRQRAQQGRRNRPGQPKESTVVPTIQSVVPGAVVSIVLKADQPTGREVQGTVQELLTRGNHPRGIKVRLQDGRVGRVQRMFTGEMDASASSESGPPTTTPSRPRRGWKNRDIRLDDNQGLPPPRTLADFLPPEPQVVVDTVGQTAGPQSETEVTCPFCDFRGDEAAVSHHIDEHIK